jgi:monoterpene epsilon-lactone hydrolase
MTSFRTRAATRLVSTLGVKRRLQELADSYYDPAQFDRLLLKIRKYDRRDPPSKVGERLDHEQIDVDGQNLHMFSNGDGGSGRVILYLHGGGYMFGPFAPEWKMASSITASTNSDLAVFLYPRTPEDQAERTVDATLEAYQAVVDGYADGEVVLLGTSAGGGLSIVLMVEAALRGMRAPSRAVLVSPAVDMVLQENLDAAEVGDALLSADYVRLAGRLYAGALPTDHPWVSPTYGNLEGLPPLQVFSGSREILSPGIESFVERVRAEGSSVELIVGQDQQHTWPTMSTPEGHQARDAIAAFIVAENT